MIVLEVKDVGGLVGRQRFEFREGVNEILAPNAAGKTSLVRAIVSLLAPIPPEQLLNIDSDEGCVKLEVGGREYVRAFKRIGGRVVETESRPLAKDERFRYIVLDPDLGLISKRIMLEKDPDITDYIIKVFKLDEMRMEMETLRKKCDELRKRKESLEKSVEELRKKGQEKELLLRQREGLLSELKVLEKIEAEKIKSLERRIIELEGRASSLSARIENISAKIIPNIEDQIREVEAEIERLETIVRDFYIRYEEPEKDIDKIKARIDEVDKQIVKLERELEEKYGKPVVLALRAYESKADACPVCGRHVVEPERFWRERVESLESIRRDYNMRKRNAEEERKRLWSELERLQIKFNEVREIEKVKLPGLRLVYDRLMRERDNYSNEVKKLKVEREIILKEVEELKAKIPEEDRIRAEKRLDLERRIRAIEQLIKDLDEVIKSMGKAGEELIEVERALEETSKTIEDKERVFHETISKMSDEFARVASEIIKEFGFEWLRGIRLARVSEEGREKYIIRVIRRFPSGREYEQPLELLSTSEKLIISLITVLVGYRLKIVEEYGQNVPIVADESLLSLDPERLERTIDELKRYSKYAIITRLARPTEVPTITIVYR